MFFGCGIEFYEFDVRDIVDNFVGFLRVVNDVRIFEKMFVFGIFCVVVGFFDVVVVVF